MEQLFFWMNLDMKRENIFPLNRKCASAVVTHWVEFLSIKKSFVVCRDEREPWNMNDRKKERGALEESEKNSFQEDLLDCADETMTQLNKTFCFLFTSKAVFFRSISATIFSKKTDVQAMNRL